MRNTQTPPPNRERIMNSIKCLFKGHIWIYKCEGVGQHFMICGRCDKTILAVGQYL